MSDTTTGIIPIYGDPRRRVKTALRGQPEESLFGGELYQDAPTNEFALQRGPAPRPEPIAPHDPTKPITYENLTGVPSREMATSVANRSQPRSFARAAADVARSLAAKSGSHALVSAAEAGIAGGQEVAKMSPEELKQAGVLGTAMRGAGAATSNFVERELAPLERAGEVWDASQTFLYGQGADPKQADKMSTEAAARAAARRGKAAEDAAGQGTNDPSLNAPQPTPEATAEPPGTSVKAVKMPDGKVIFTNVPARSIEKGGEAMDYEAAVAHVRNSRPGVRTFADNAPQAGPAPVMAQPEIQGFTSRARTGTHNTETLRALDPRIQQYEADKYAGEVAGDTAARMEGREVQDAQREATVAQARQAQYIASMDPLAAAKIAAESKYGGEIIEKEAEAEKIAAAVRNVGVVTDKINEALRTMPPGPERDAHIKRLEEERKLYAAIFRPQMASGLYRPDPYAMFGGMSAPTPPTKED